MSVCVYGSVALVGGWVTGLVGWWVGVGVGEGGVGKLSVKVGM